MWTEAIGTGETIELAKRNAYSKLGIEDESVSFEILQLPAKKTFGIFGGKEAIVRAYIEIEDTPDVRAENYIRDILKQMGVESFTLSKKLVSNGAEFELNGEDLGFLVGKRGEILDSLQYLAGLVANEKKEGYYRININIGDFREARKKSLEKLARNMSARAIRNRRSYALEPMNPYERKIIHNEVQKIDGACSWSEGRDLGRYVIISGRPQGKNDHFRRGREQFRRRPYKKRYYSNNEQNNGKTYNNGPKK